MATTWYKLDSAGKLTQLVVSHVTRKEVVEKSPESDLVMAIGNKFWEKVEGHATDALKTIYAGGI